MQRYFDKLLRHNVLTYTNEKIKIDKYEKILIKIKDFTELSNIDFKFLETLNKYELLNLLTLFNSNVNYMNEYIVSLNN